MKIVKKTSITNAIYALMMFFIFFLFAIRDNNFVSDGDNYKEYYAYPIDFLDKEYYYYPAFWALVYIFKIFGAAENLPSYLSVFVSTCIIASSMKLKNGNRIIFIFFCIANAAIFNTTQIALKNGVALGVLLLGLAYRKNIPIANSILFHPGTLPISSFLLFAKLDKNLGRRMVNLAIFVGIVLSFIFFAGDMIESRGYQSGLGREAKIITYSVTGVLAWLYYMSFQSGLYRYLMPMMLCVWIFSGIWFEFGGRLFLQTLIVSLFLILKFGDVKKYSQLFLLGFFAFSIYGTLMWHPLHEYNQGFFEYWMNLL